MTQLKKGESRLSLVRKGIADNGIAKRGRLFVSIRKLREDPRNERKIFRNMKGLVASIEAVGMIEPITVTAQANDTYRIITGHRRFRAAKAARLDTVEILIRDPEDEVIRRQKSVISNVQREDVGPVELAEALQTMIDEDKRINSQDDLARILGKDKTWVSGILRILSMPAKLQRRVGSTQLSISYDAVIRIARLENQQHQEQLVELLLGGATLREIREHIDALKGKPKDSASTPKPKRVYHTKYQATVIIQSTSGTLDTDRTIGALQEALGKATDGVGDDTGK